MTVKHDVPLLDIAEALNRMCPDAHAAEDVARLPRYAAFIEPGTSRVSAQVVNDGLPRVDYIPADMLVHALKTDTLHDRSEESLRAYYFAGQSSIIGYGEWSSGSPAKSVVESSTITRLGTLLGADAIAVCHNHPRGYVRPSEDDLRFTGLLALQCLAFNMTLREHFIVGLDVERQTPRFFSMKSAGLIDQIMRWLTKRFPNGALMKSDLDALASMVNGALNRPAVGIVTDHISKRLAKCAESKENG